MSGTCCGNCEHFKPYVTWYRGSCAKFKGEFKRTALSCGLWAYNNNPVPRPKPAPDGPSKLRARSKAAQSRATRNGDEVERIFAASCEAYRATGEAMLFKRPPVFRFIGQGIAPTGSAGVDFFGSLAGGRAVAVEVKSRAVRRLPLDCIQPNQAEELAELQSLGALALVAVKLTCRGDPMWWVLLWPEWTSMVRRAEAIGRSSAGIELLNAFGRRCNLAEPYDRPLWLEAALRAPRLCERPKIVEKSEE